MKVFLVGMYEDIEGVFSTKENALAYMAREVDRHQRVMREAGYFRIAETYHKAYWLEEYEVDSK